MLCLGAAIALTGCNKESGTTAGAKNTTKITTSDAPVDTRREVVSAGKSKRPDKPSRAEKAAAETARLEAPTTGTALLVSGKITFADGRPATSASVELKYFARNEDDYNYAEKTMGQTVTDDEGRYRVRGEGVGMNYTLLITGDVPETSVRLETPSPMRRGLNKITRDITLSESFDVNGRVTNEKNEPVAGATIALIPDFSAYRQEGSNSYNPPKQTPSTKSRITTSSATGEFTLPFIDKGKWTIGTVSPGYAAVTQLIEVPTTGPVALQLSNRGGTVVGSVHTKADASPVASLKLKLGGMGDFGDALYNKNTSTGADGSFRFDNVTSTNLFLTVPQEETDAKKLAITDPRPSRISVGEGETTEVQLFVYPGITITGRVYDKDTNDPLPDATVTAVTTPRRTTTSGADGQYRLENVFLTSNRVSVNPVLEGYAIATTRDNMYNSMNAGISAVAPDAPSMTVDLPMERQVSISGKVVTADEVPAGFAQLRVINGRSMYSGMRNNSLTPANADGTFKVYTTPFSSSIVEAQAAGFADSRSDEINVTTEDIKDIKIVLEVGGTIEGVVLDPSGTPAEGAKVTNINWVKLNGSSTGNHEEVGVTGKDGKFTMLHATKEVSLFAAKEGFAQSESVKVQVKSGETKSDVQLKLRQAFTISGTVKRTNGDPVETGSVNCWSSSGGSSGNTQLQPGGKFKLENLADGLYNVQVYGSGVSSKQVENVKAGTENLEIVIDEVKTVDGKPANVTLVGTVVDEETGQPIKDLEIPPYGNMKKLDKDGQFEYSGLRPDTSYSFNISAPGYMRQQFTTKVPGDKTRYEETFKLGHGGLITGRVLGKDNTPLPNIMVVNWGSTQYYERSRTGPDTHTTTDNEGRFTLVPVPTGENTIEVMPKPPLTAAYKKVTVKSAETADAGDIILSAGGKITGQVVRGASEDPVPDRDISINAYIQESNTSINKSATTDKDGRFEVADLPAGSYSINCGSTNQSVQLAAEETKDVKLKIGGVKMFGTVTRGGEPVNQSISGTGPGSRISAYAQGGNYTFTDILPGDYEFQLSYGAHPVTEKLTVPDQEEFEHNFELPNGGINVTVVNEAGEPMGAVRVSLSQKASESGYDQSWVGRTSSEQTDSQGKCKFSGLAAGTFTLSATKSDVGNAMNPAVQVGNAPVDVQLVLKQGGGTLVSVALNSATGGAVAEAWCYLYGPNGQFTHGAKRDASGVMTIKNIPPGTYTTNVSYWSFSTATRTVEIKEGESQTIEDVLYPAGAITWTLKTANGYGARAARVTVTPIQTDPVENPRSGQTNSSGQYVERGLAPGTYQATAVLDGKPGPTETFTVAAGGNAAKETTVPNW